MCRALAVAALLLGAAAPAARAAPPLAPREVRLVGRAAKDAPWTDAPTEARKADHPELAVVVLAREGKQRVVVADDDVAPLVLGGKQVPAARRRGWDRLGEAAVRWSTVEPHAWREPGVAARNGATTDYHSNVSTSPDDFGKWLGYDEITYFETVLGDWSAAKAARRRPASARPRRAEDDVHDGLGTLRYRVELRDAGGKILATPGAGAVDADGMLPTVHRVSIRADDSFLGYLTSYFLVPEVFGSAGPGASHQTERFVGADCADVLTGAVRRMGHRAVDHTNVAGLPSYATAVAGPVDLDDHGVPSGPLLQVRVGDLIRIDYGGTLAGATPRAWDHVAALYEDRSDPAGPSRGAPDGLLDGFDLVVHMGHPRLVVEPLREQAPARVDVWRWDPRKLGQRRR